MVKTEPVSSRFKPNILKALDDIAKANGSTRTDIIERYLEEGIKRTKGILNKRTLYYILVISSISLFLLKIWLHIL